MNRYVVSAQRSGLNWFRFCFESFYGRRTPGKTSLLHKTTHGEQAFLRSHDALNLTARARKRPKALGDRSTPRPWLAIKCC